MYPKVVSLDFGGTARATRDIKPTASVHWLINSLAFHFHYLHFVTFPLVPGCVWTAKMDMLDVGRSDAVGFGYVSQILLCLYGARFSYVAITNLRKYEETTKKAAKWSQLVQDHLTKTRTTQATGALCVCLLLCITCWEAIGADIKRLSFFSAFPFLPPSSQAPG